MLAISSTPELLARDGEVGTRQSAAVVRFTPRATEHVFDGRGHLLADVRLSPSDTHEGRWVMEPVSAAPFLDYYFGQGGQHVCLEGHDSTLRARLLTSLRDDRRVWSLEIVSEPIDLRESVERYLGGGGVTP